MLESILWLFFFTLLFYNLTYDVLITTFMTYYTQIVLMIWPMMPGLQTNCSSELRPSGAFQFYILCFCAALRPQGCVGGPRLLGDWHLPVVSHVHAGRLAPAAAAPPRGRGVRRLLGPEGRSQEGAAAERQRRRPTGEQEYAGRTEKGEESCSRAE